MKKYGQDLKKSLSNTRTKLNNLKSDITKRFDMVVSKYSIYLSDEEKKYIQRVGINDLTIDKKLELIILVEERYIKENSNQLNIFDNE